VILLPQTGESDACQIAERLRTHVANLAVPVDDSADPACVRLTISVGVAAMDGSDHELTDLLAAADAALYYAKQAGRNRTHVFATAPAPVLAAPLSVPAPAAAVASAHFDGRRQVRQAGRIV
jgi:predicted signal transduction protein with EAL and GGDEF domain